MADPPDEIVLPVVEEQLSVGRRAVATGRVRVTTQVEEHPVVVRESLVRSSVEVERRAIGKEVLTVPPVRDEGDTIVVPVVREEIVVTKRLILVEEVHLRRVAATEDVSQTVVVRRQHPVIERDPQ
ncbi:MAG: YsnF/AvaK domain-containing protein [Sphingomonadaceae bacterium]|nr:YsnF/AvaK domain-containing protein [Sphingomonadaceae bacterium]